jgi:hypothetical protein
MHHVTHTCVSCATIGDDLKPLYVDRSANVHPVAWIHGECLENYLALEKAEAEPSLLLELLRQPTLLRRCG